VVPLRGREAEFEGGYAGMAAERHQFWTEWNAQFAAKTGGSEGTLTSWTGSGPMEWTRTQAARRPTPVAARRRAVESANDADLLYQIEWVPLRPLAPATTGDALVERNSEQGLAANAGTDGGQHEPEEGKLERGAAAPVWLFGLLAQGLGWSAVAPQSTVAIHYLVFGANKRAFMRATGAWHPLASATYAAEKNADHNVNGEGDKQDGGFKALALTGAGVLDQQGAAVFASRVAFDATMRKLGIIAAATGRRPAIPRVPCTAPWLPRAADSFAGVSAGGLIDVVAAPCGSPTRRG
jgi:hypothetical protein